MENKFKNQESLHSLRKLADEKFNGDISKAMEYLLRTEPSFGVMNDMINACSLEDKKKAWETYKEIMDDEFPGGLKTAVKESKLSVRMKVTVDEIRKSDVNKAKARINKAFLKFLLMGAAFVAGSVALGATTGLVAPGMYGVIAALITGPAALKFSNSIINYISYLRLKREYKTKKYKDKIPNYLDHKKMYDNMQKLIMQGIVVEDGTEESKEVEEYVNRPRI